MWVVWKNVTSSFDDAQISTSYFYQNFIFTKNVLVEIFIHVKWLRPDKSSVDVSKFNNFLQTKRDRSKHRL